MEPRRKKLMSSLFYAVERIGGAVAGNEDGALVTFGNQTLECRLMEKLRNVRLPLTDRDIKFRNTSYARGYNVGLEVTGILAFEIESYLRSQVQQVWKETAERQLEVDIPAIADALKKGAGVRQDWDDETFAATEKARRQERLRERARNEAAVELARWQLLVQLASERTEVQKVVEFVRNLELSQQNNELSGNVDDDSLAPWMEWLELTMEQRGGPKSLRELFRMIGAVKAPE